MFGEGGGCGRTFFRLLVADAVGENECAILAETVPQWVYDVTVKVYSCEQFLYLFLKLCFCF